MDSQSLELARKFYDENRRAFYTYALSLTRDHEAAEDIVHSVFEKLLRKILMPREPRPYVYKAIRNAACDLLRRNHRVPGTASLYDEESADPIAEVSLREEAERLLAMLADDERECVVLKLFAGLTFQEIARVRGVNINTAASSYRRAIAKMKETAMEAIGHE